MTFCSSEQEQNVELAKRTLNKRVREVLLSGNEDDGFVLLFEDGSRLTILADDHQGMGFVVVRYNDEECAEEHFGNLSNNTELKGQKRGKIMEIKPKDIIISVFVPARLKDAGRPYHIGVKVYHKPSGIEVARETENNLYANKRECLDALAALLAVKETNEMETEFNRTLSPPAAEFVAVPPAPVPALEIGDISFRGTEKTWVGPLANWDKHSNIIMEWCDGAKVDVAGKNGVFYPLNYTGRPSFLVDHSYRISKRGPKDGEVWGIKTSGGPHDNPFPRIDCVFYGDKFYSLKGAAAYLVSPAAEFVAASVEEYYREQF